MDRRGDSSSSRDVGTIMPKIVQSEHEAIHLHIERASETSMAMDDNQIFTNIGIHYRVIRSTEYFVAELC